MAHAVGNFFKFVRPPASVAVKVLVLWDASCLEAAADSEECRQHWDLQLLSVRFATTDAYLGSIQMTPFVLNMASGSVCESISWTLPVNCTGALWS